MPTFMLHALFCPKCYLLIIISK